MKQAVEKRLGAYLAVGKLVVEKCVEREARLVDVCPQRYASINGETKTTALRGIASLSKEISTLVERLNRLDGEGIGFSVVLGKKPDELVAVVLCLLLSARLDGAAGDCVRTVQDAMNYAACRSSSVSLAARNMFRSDGVLFSLTALGMGRGYALDSCSVTLRESVLNRILHQPSDATEARCEAEILTGRGR